MTLPEHQLIEAQTMLSDETCRCTNVPVIAYEPGVMWIECGRCGNSFAVPDFDTGAVLEGWRERNN